MIRCLVTDRRRLCPGAETWAEARHALIDQARRAIDARIDLIQVRERDLDGAVLASLVADFVALTRGTMTRILVNDRLDVALACDADGVHLRADSIRPADVRRLAPPPFLVSRSVHGAAEAAAVGPVDFVIAGTVFRSASKSADTPLLGLAGLSAVAHATTVPVLAIGGISKARVAEVMRAGAAGIAAIGMFIDTIDRRS